MIAVKPVVVGIADKQPTALRFALREAAARRAPLHVVHAATIPAQAAAYYVGETLYEEIRTAGETILSDARAHLMHESPSIDAHYILSNSPALRALEEESVGAALLVVGSDDISWFERMVGSAIAEQVARRAPVPVVVVPERQWPEPLEGGVVVALDGVTPTSGPLRFAFEQAIHRGSALHVLHASPPGTSQADAEERRANVRRDLADWQPDFPDVRVVTSFPVDEPDEACIRATGRAELVVVGRPRHFSTPFALSRPVAVQVLRNAHGPVAVVPADYAGD